MRKYIFHRDALRKDLKKRTIQAGVIRIITSGAQFVITIGAVVVLARLLSPEEFGLFAMVATFSEFARTFVDLGLGTSTIQRDNTSHGEVSALFLINMCIGICLVIFMAALSPVIAWFYNDYRLFQICLVLSPVFLFKGLTVQHQALLERQMKFGLLGITNILSSALALSVAIITATLGYGVWALVWRELVLAAFYALGVWFFCGWIPGRPKFDVETRKCLWFGADLSLNNIIQYFTRNLDKILIGRFCGPNVLGFYSKAAQLAMMPIEQIKIAVVAVSLSPLSTLQHEPIRYRNFYIKMLSLLSFVYMPAVMFLALKAEDIVLLLLGSQWIEAAHLFRILAIAVFVRPIMATFEQVMISSGKTRRYLLWGILNSVFLIMAFAIGIRWNAAGVAYSYAVVNYCLFVWSMFYCLKGVPINVLIIIKITLLPFISTLFTGLFLIVVEQYIYIKNLFVDIVFSIFIIGLIYLILWMCVPYGRHKLNEFMNYRKELLK